MISSHSTTDLKLQLQLQKHEWMATGIFCILLLILTPIWNAVLLLHDPGYMYFQGGWHPTMIIVSCAMLFLLYTIAILNVFRQLKCLADEKVLHRLAAVMCMMLGCMLMYSSIIFDFLATETYVELFSACSTGPLSMALYETSERLYVLRQDPACAAEETVENCALFKRTRHTDALKDMENRYECSGFCYDGIVIGLEDAEKEPGKNLEAAFEEGLAEEEKEEMRDYTPPHPPTLFSKANYDFSCDGMTANSMLRFVGNVGLQCYFEGFVLLAAASAVGWSVIMEGCSRHDTEKTGWSTGESTEAVPLSTVRSSNKV